MSIVVQNVSRYYGPQKALDSVSLEIHQGEVVALLGPNGAGKSTMMKIITCYLPHHSGQVEVCGYNVVNQSLAVRRKVGYLPEHNPLYLDMYVREYLEFAAGIHKLGRQTAARVKEMIELTGLAREQHKLIGALSKGYRQRVGLAQALIHDPEVLVLDEPTSGLDPNQLVDIRNLIREIGKQKTILLSTHIMQEVEAVCDRVIIIDKGQIKADAPTRQLQMLNKTRQIIWLELENPVAPELLRQLDGVIEVVQEKDARYRIFAREGKDLRPGIFHFAVKQNWVIMGMGMEEQSIEQVFRDLTRSA